MVKLVAVTPDAEAVIAHCARVSSPQNRDNLPEKLLAYCIKHGHWSVFEMANMVLEIVTSRAMSAQILRHRSFSFQEFSQRYAVVPEVLFYRARRQDPANRQHSVDDLPQETREWWDDAQRDLALNATRIYQAAVARGIAKECARFVLPMASKTVLCMNGTVRSWILGLCVVLILALRGFFRDVKKVQLERQARFVELVRKAVREELDKK